MAKLTFAIFHDTAVLAKLGVMQQWSEQAVWMAERSYISRREAECRLDQYFDFVEQIARSSRALTRQASAEGGAPGRHR